MMKQKHLLRIILALCAFILISCSDKDGGENLPPQTTEEPSAPETPSVTFSTEDQKAVNGKIAVTYDVPSAIASQYERVKVAVYHGEYLVCETPVDTSKTTASASTSYGKLKVDLVGQKASGEQTVLGSADVKMWSDEYNLAMLNASFPVVYFTLDLFSMQGETANNFYRTDSLPMMKNAPTFVAPERSSSYSWDDLPENVHPLPNISRREATSGTFHNLVIAMTDYIKELYEVNASSVFHFYAWTTTPN